MQGHTQMQLMCIKHIHTHAQTNFALGPKYMIKYICIAQMCVRTQTHDHAYGTHL